MNGKTHGTLTNDELKDFFDNTNVSISSNGILYDQSKMGLFPSILTKWFDERTEYRKLAKKYADEGDDEKHQYFNRRQHLQKILLNSFYGIVGLSVSRWYDRESAEAVTTTGQNLIKFSAKVANHYYNKELNDNKNYVIYCDHDSIYVSALPLIKNRIPDIDTKNENIMTEKVLGISSEVQSYLNSSYDYFAERFLNIKNNHRFKIKQELIAKSGLFITKKRYGLHLINDNGVPVDKISIIGFETVRSDFPKAFRKFLKDTLGDVLDGKNKQHVDKKITDLKHNIKKLSINDISNPTGVNGIKKWTESKTTMKKGAPIHVKASVAYNNLLKHFKRDKKYKKIYSGDKIKWVYLKNNEFGLNALAYTGAEDPPEIMDFIEKYTDYEKMFDRTIQGRIKMVYGAMNWGDVVDAERSIERFF